MAASDQGFRTMAKEALVFIDVLLRDVVDLRGELISNFYLFPMMLAGHPSFLLS